MVAIANISEDCLFFYSNYKSKKGIELEANPKASGCFYWDSFRRQVILTGHVMRIPREESEKYFYIRSFDFQVQKLVTEQDQPIKDRQSLMDKFKEVGDQYKEENKVPMPDFW
jgi:pyridoxamine 5'-phosphate oxidase